MYDYEEIKEKIEQIRLTLDLWESKLHDPDINKYYKKNNKSAGKRIRKALLAIQKQCRLMRNDIRRLTKERELFEGTEHAKDYKREKRIDSSSS